MELCAGAKKPKQKTHLKTLFRPYIKGDRIVQLSLKEFLESGEALAKIRKKNRSITPGFSHDVMIALSARSIGATLLSNNKRDFEMISKVIVFKYQNVS